MVVAAEWVTVTTDDSRRLEVLLQGPSDGFPLLYHSGTPSAAAPYEALAEAAGSQGLRTVTYSRPGYGESTERPGRSVADVTSDVSAVLAALGLEQFVTLGWSGGGPHALACAALMPQACKAAATLAGVAPWDAAGLDWLDGMGDENVAEFGAVAAGREALSEYLAGETEAYRAVSGVDVAAALGDLVSDVDRHALTGDLAEYIAESMRRSVLHGVGGWRDDDLAFARPWGFAVDTMAVPVVVWQGGEDRMVPLAHGQWLAQNVCGARDRVLDNEGHVSLVVQLPRILEDLARVAGLC